MEERKFKWFVQELSNKRTKLLLLEFLVCSGEHIRLNFSKDPLGFFRLVPIEPLKIKHFLIKLLEYRSPKLKVYAPNKVFGVLYQRGSMRVLTGSSILELPATRVHSMKIQSIHILPEYVQAVTIYRARTIHEVGEILCSFSMIYRSESAVKIPKNEAYLKIKELAIGISHFVHKFCSHTVSKIAFDLAIDSVGQASLIKVIKISVAKKSDIEIKEYKKIKTNLKVDNSPSGRRHVTQLRNKKNKSQSNNELRRPLFIEMIAKTINRERRGKLDGARPIVFNEEKQMSTLQELLDNLALTKTKEWSRNVVSAISQNNTPMRTHPKSGSNSHFTDDLTWKITRFKLDAEKRREIPKFKSLTHR